MEFLSEIWKVLVCPGVKDVECSPLPLKEDETANKIQNWEFQSKRSCKIVLHKVLFL